MRAVNKMCWITLTAMLLVSLEFGCGSDSILKSPQSLKEEGISADQSLPWSRENAQEIKEIYGISPDELAPFPPVDRAIAMQQVVLQRRRELYKASTRAKLTYDRNASTEYALEWSVEELRGEIPKRNTKVFRTFDNNCANYGSQCLWAGGVSMFWGSVPLRMLPIYWWYKFDQAKKGQSWSWTQASVFHFFLFFQIGDLKEHFHHLEKGDFILLDKAGDGFADHVVIVTERKDYDDIYISANTTDHHNLPFLDFWHEVEKNPKEYPNPKVYLYHINLENAEDNPNPPPPPPDDSSSDSSTSTTPDTTPPNVLTAGCRVEQTGDGKYIIAVAFDAPDFNSGWLQLEDSNGARHGIGGQNWTNPVVLEHNMTGWPYGLYKVITWAKDNSENASPLMDTGLRIGWGAPWIEVLNFNKKTKKIF